MREDFGTARVESIEEDGSFDTQYGRMFGFWVVLDNGVRGAANSKRKEPPYRVGDEVEYEITGQTKRGDNKLKIQRVREEGAGGRESAPSRPSGRSFGSRQPPARQNAATGSGKPSGNDYAEGQRLSREGQRIGLCIGQAGEDMRSMGERFAIGDHEDVKRFVWQRASAYLAVAKALESGKVSVAAKDPPPTRSDPDPEPDDDSDVPFN